MYHISLVLVVTHDFNRNNNNKLNILLKFKHQFIYILTHALFCQYPPTHSDDILNDKTQEE